MSNTKSIFTTAKFLPFTAETPIGTVTNMGTLTHFDKYGTAHFDKDGRKGSHGNKTFHFIQIPIK